MGPGKGNTNNPAGKPKGTLNKTTVIHKEWIANFINERLPEVAAAWNELDAKDKMKFLIDLLKFVTPQMASSSVSLETTEEIKRTVHDLFPESLNGKS
jgi:hypothetical protein